MLGKRNSEFLIDLSRIQELPRYHSNSLFFNQLNWHLRSVKGEINRKCCCQDLFITFLNCDTFISLPPNNNMSTFASKYVDNLDKMLQTWISLYREEWGRERGRRRRRSGGESRRREWGEGEAEGEEEGEDLQVPER